MFQLRFFFFNRFPTWPTHCGLDACLLQRWNPVNGALYVLHEHIPVQVEQAKGKFIRHLPRSREKKHTETSEVTWNIRFKFKKRGKSNRIQIKQKVVIICFIDFSCCSSFSATPPLPPPSHSVLLQHCCDCSCSGPPVHQLITPTPTSLEPIVFFMTIHANSQPTKRSTKSKQKKTNKKSN